jgi:hypothetical protein
MKWLMALMFALAGAAIAGAADTAKTVRDWSARCNEKLDCKAEVAGWGGQGYRLQLLRDNGLDEGWRLVLVARKVPQPAVGVYPVVKVDGAEIAATEVMALDDDASFGFADEEALPRIFAAMRKGSRIDISFPAEGKDVSESFSLSGLSAIILWADEQQSRVGYPQRVVAYPLAQSGEELQGAAADAFKAEILEASPARGCQWLGEEADPAAFKVESFVLGEGKTLYVVPCFMGAYQGSSILFLRDGDGLKPLAFPEYSESLGWSGTFEIGYEQFNPGSKVLSTLVKFRGLGDCGATAEYQWRRFGFKLLEYRYRGKCADDPPGDIPEYPVIYKADEGE